MKNRNNLKSIPVIGFVCLSTWVYWYFFYDKPLIGIDDAVNYFVYMRNLARGAGFVYNAGGEHVEGFTSLLWTLIGSIFFKISTHPEIWLFFINVLMIIITLWQLAVFIDKFFDDKRILSPYAFFVLGVLLVIPGYYEWTALTLMETSLWSCLLIATILNLCYFEFESNDLKQLNKWLSVFLMLLVLSRPESYLWGLVFLAIRFVQFYHLKKDKKNALLSIALPAACFIITIAALTGWRMFYFGFPFPNTYYDKVSVDHIYNIKEGFKYLFNGFFLIYAFPVPISLFIILQAIKLLRSKSFTPHNRVFFILIISLLTSFAIPLYTGGDHFRLARLFQPVMPLFYFAFIIAVTGFYKLQAIKTRYYFEVVILVLLLMLTPATNYNLINYLYGYIPAIKIEFDLAERGRYDANGLNSFFKDSKLPSQGVLCAGSLAYYYNGPTIDLIGLNNVAMAHASPVKKGFKNHAAFDKETFYRLAPDIALTTRFVTDTSHFELEENMSTYNNDDFSLGTIYKGIFKDDRFRNQYLPVFIFRKNEKQCLHTYANKDFLSRLDSSIFSCSIIKR